MRLACGIASMGLILLLAPFPVTASGDGGPPEWPNKFTWHARSSFAGDVLVEVSVDWGTDNECVMMHEAAGDTVRTGLHRFRMSSRGGWSTSGGGNLVTAVVQAHAGEIDTRDITDSGTGGWGSRSTSWGPGYSGTETITYGAIDVRERNFSGEAWGPFRLELSCKDPFSVTTLAGSTQLVAFTQATMEGAGASVSPLLAPEASVNIDDGHAGSFDTDRVRFAVRGFQGAGAAAGQIVLDHPDGSEVFTVTSLSTDVDHQGGAGDYQFRVTRAGAALTDAFWGFLGGLDDVEDLDEILG